MARQQRLRRRIGENARAVFRALSVIASATVLASVILGQPSGAVQPESQQGERSDSATQTPVAIVESFHERLIQVMKNADTMAYEDRREHLQPAVYQSYDSAFMARIASGPHWKDMTEADKQEVVMSFRAFTLANYAGRFNGYSGQSFETIDCRDQGRGRIFVRTRLNKGDGDSIRLDYLLHKVGEGWKIVDVFLDGKFSELALRRSEFAPILRKGGAEALIELLRTKVKELETTSS